MILQLPCGNRIGRPAKNKTGGWSTPEIIGHLLTCCLVVLMNIPSSLLAAQPSVSDLLNVLNLSGYPPTMRAPRFTARTAEGQTVSLAGLRGKVVLLNFWASWCPDCRPEMPLFDQLHRDFAAKGLIVLGINVREGARTVQNYGKELGLTFPLLLDPKGEINTAYGVIGLPTTFLIGRDGRAVALAVGPRDWASPPARRIIQALLAEPAALKGTR